jgi:hypothetical protein
MLKYFQKVRCSLLYQASPTSNPVSPQSIKFTIPSSLRQNTSYYQPDLNPPENQSDSGLDVTYPNAFYDISEIITKALDLQPIANFNDGHLLGSAFSYSQLGKDAVVFQVQTNTFFLVAKGLI